MPRSIHVLAPPFVLLACATEPAAGGEGALARSRPNEEGAGLEHSEASRSDGAGSRDGEEPMPAGQWSLAWADEFAGEELDRDTWDTQTDAYEDMCRGNLGDHKLQALSDANVAVKNGVLTITARRETRGSYTWTSGLVATGQNCRQAPRNARVVRPGQYLSQRARLPKALGMWSSFWTWGGGEQLGRNEVDVYEVHGDAPNILELTNHSLSPETAGTGFRHDLGRAVSDDWHVFGVHLGRDAVTWYLDGNEVFRGAGYSPSPEHPEAAVMIDLSVADGFYHRPPDVDSAELLVDWVRVYSPADAGPDLCACTDPGVPFPECPPEKPSGCP